MKRLIKTLCFSLLLLCIVALSSTAYAQSTKQGDVGFGLIPFYLSNEKWYYRWGVSVRLTQESESEKVQVYLGWRRDTQFAPEPRIPPPVCSPGTSYVFSNGANIVFENGVTLSTSDGSLTASEVVNYGYDYVGRYVGNINDLGNNPSVYINGGFNYISTCGNGLLSLSPSSTIVPLQ